MAIKHKKKEEVYVSVTIAVCVLTMAAPDDGSEALAVMTERFSSGEWDGFAIKQEDWRTRFNADPLGLTFAAFCVLGKRAARETLCWHEWKKFRARDSLVNKRKKDKEEGVFWFVPFCFVNLSNVLLLLLFVQLTA